MCILPQTKINLYNFPVTLLVVSFIVYAFHRDVVFSIWYILKQWIAVLARSDWLLELGIASAFTSPSICARKLLSLTGINELKMVSFVLYYLTVLVDAKTTIHLSVGGQRWFLAAR